MFIVKLFCFFGEGVGKIRPPSTPTTGVHCCVCVVLVFAVQIKFATSSRQAHMACV